LKNKIPDSDKLNALTEINYELGTLLERVRSALFRMRELVLAQEELTNETAAILSTLQLKGGAATIDELANISVGQYRSVASIVARMEKTDR
jgi:hypothetical protein